MKLILSSCDFKNENSKQFILDNIPKPISEIKVLFMPDECASKKEILSDKFYDRLVSYGFKRENITVLNYYYCSPLFGGLQFFYLLSYFFGEYSVR